MNTTSVGENPHVFLCYRRNDTSAVTGRLSDRLRLHFGDSNVFLDIDEIALGANIKQAIQDAIRATDVVLVLIGDRWLEDTRLEFDFDFVRMEIEAAFKMEKVIIPVLVDGARMPAATQFPESIRTLAELNAAALLSRDRFGSDVERIIAAIEDNSPTRVKTSPTPENLSGVGGRNRRLIFVSYAHEDVQWLDRVKIHLKPLTRGSRLELWDDSKIQVGDEWRNEIKKALDLCIAAILLVSADYMASDFIYNDELPPLLNDAARERGVRVLPILVSSSSFEYSDLARFQALNPPSSPLDMMQRGEQDATLLRLFTSIRPLVPAE